MTQPLLFYKALLTNSLESLMHRLTHHYHGCEREVWCRLQGQNVVRWQDKDESKNSTRAVLAKAPMQN